MGHRRSDLLAATEKLLAPITARVQAGRLAGAAKIGVEVGKVISKYKTAKHFAVTITDNRLTVTRDQDQIDAEAARAWAPLTFTGEQPPEQDNPVTPARRSAWAQAKASYQYDPAGQPYRSFRGLLEHLATLTRNQVRFAGTGATVPMLAGQRPAGSFPLARRPDPAHLEVARTPPRPPRQSTRSGPEPPTELAVTSA